jgi:hypothetical protein
LREGDFLLKWDSGVQGDEEPDREGMVKAREGVPMKRNPKRTTLRAVLGLVAIMALLVASGCGANRPPRDLKCGCEGPPTQYHAKAVETAPAAGTAGTGCPADSGCVYGG